ncbi:MAG: diacylglycerol kinase family lipid kinase [Spirochaetaceae bacterium]|jgi:YegS/Rv2252/BmrU family lipid kinase|nr:diacylglycerol kinase family lipid kinase [Spirochaetaceae bacterium]
MAPKIIVILNPIAGKGKATKSRPLIDAFLKERGLDYELFLTERAGHAMEIAQNCRLKEDTIVTAAGGDGTANEVANGLLRRGTPSPPVMAVLPVGRGNDFSYNAGVGGDLTDALVKLAEGRHYPLDAGVVRGGFFPDGRYFVNGLGIGFDCKVGFEAAKLRIKSGLTYAIGALITLLKYEDSPVLEVEYDGKKLELSAAIVSIMNGVRMGGVFMMGPSALIDDGVFDICMVRDPRRRARLLKIIFSYTKGGQEAFEETVIDRGREFLLKAVSGGMAAHCDGETVCTQGTELTVKCIPSALRLIR